MSYRRYRFEDDDGEPRSSSAGAAGRRKGGASTLDFPKDDSDWLGLKDDRPRSADVLDKPSSILKASPPEPASDWLGLSRLGSPESPRPPQISATAKSKTVKEGM